MKSGSRGQPLSDVERQELVRMIDADGIDALLESSGLSRTALLNAAIGLPVIPGTRRLVRDLIDDDDDVDDGEEEDDEEDADGDEDS